MQLADELEATQSKAKADWECWKEAEKRREFLDLQINGLFLFEWDDLSEEALRDADKRLRQRQNAYKLMKTEMALSISRTGIRPFPSLRDSDTLCQRRAGARPRPGLT